MYCECEKPLPEPDSMSCLKCGRSSVAALERPKTFRVDPRDALLQYRRRVSYQAAKN